MKANSKNKICVLGAGSWGTALAQHLLRVGHIVKIWSPETNVLEDIRVNNKNSKYFPANDLTPGLIPVADLDEALKSAELVVVAVPSFAYREVSKKLTKIKDASPLLVSCGKGFEEQSLNCLTDVLHDALDGYTRVAALSGPSFAQEVLNKLPTAVVIASKDEAVAKEAALAFHFDYFRVYTSTDLVGVELGGALKNVIALAVGMVDGAGMGNNARAALVTRGLAEIQRLVLAMGGQQNTIMGLSGLGDLLLTSTGDLSRNRRAGLALGKGEKIQDVLKNIGQVVEGVVTAPKAKALADRYQVSMPIVEAVNKVLSGEILVSDAVKLLLSRAQRSEA